MSSEKKRGRILCLDDESGPISTYKLILEPLGYEVVGYTKKAEALKKLAEIKPDLVTTDMNSPDLSGLDVLRYVKRFDPSILVVIISGGINVEQARQAVKLGVSDVILKPFKVAELRHTVERAMEVRSGDKARHV
jgi:DNA-binding NtrC family response regulator